MTFEEVRALVAAKHPGGQALAELRHAMDDPAYREVGPGSLTVRDASQIFTIRRASARKAGKDVVGLDDLLAALARFSQEDRVLLFHFAGPSARFSVFVHERSRELIGCIRLKHSTVGIPDRE